jgi:3-polyprenyl-4-hydroxybenzoate decarboxylase
MKIFANLFGSREPHEAMGRMIEETLDESRAQLFQTRLEKERVLSDESKLMRRIERLEKEEKEHAEKREAQRASTLL